MQVFNNFRLIGVDHGYGSIKTANTVTPNGIIVSDTKPTFRGDILFWNERYYTFTDSAKDFISNKTEDDDYYAATLMGIAKEMRIANLHEADVYLAAGLPLTWVSAQVEEFKKYLMREREVRFEFNDKPFTVNLIGCKVNPQGYAAVIERLPTMVGTNMVADIGNGTINILYINNRKPVHTKFYTEKMGVNQCVIAAGNAVMDKFGVNPDRMVIENVIRSGTDNISSKYLECIKESISEYANRVYAVLKKYEYDPGMMKLYVTGGGSNILRDYLGSRLENVEYITDVRANARGYENMLYEAMKRGIV